MGREQIVGADAMQRIDDEKMRARRVLLGARIGDLAAAFEILCKGEASARG